MEQNVLLKVQETFTLPSKANVETLTNTIIGAVEAKQIDPLLALAQLTALQKAIKNSIETVRVSYALPTVKDAPVKTFEKFGAKFQIKEVGVKKNYAFYIDDNGDKHDNTDWLAKKKIVDEATAALEGEEARLDKLGHFDKFSTTSITVTLQ